MQEKWHRPHRSSKGGSIPPVIAIKVPPVNAAAPMIPPLFHFSQELLGDCSSFDSSCFNKAIAEQATIISIASCPKEEKKNLYIYLTKHEL